MAFMDNNIIIIGWGLGLGLRLDHNIIDRNLNLNSNHGPSREKPLGPELKNTKATESESLFMLNSTASYVINCKNT